jgi:hypothetical protein
MKNYLLQENLKDNLTRTCYTVDTSHDPPMVRLHTDNEITGKTMYFGWLLTENKRGWKFKTFRLNSRGINIFLDRADFTKIPIEKTT